MPGPTIAPFDVVIRIAAALVCGGLIGLERERLERAAGIRTHVLVAIGASLITIVSAFGFSDAVTADRTVAVDPSRVAAQVVSGIGFLGAGVIIFRKNTISGLTTAASVWAAAGLGLACGGGLYWPAAVATFAILLTQIGIRPLEYRFFVHHQPSNVVVRYRAATNPLSDVERLVVDAGIPLRGMRIRPGVEGVACRIDVALGTTDKAPVLRLVERLSALSWVTSVEFRRTRRRFSFNGEDIQPDDGQDTDEESAETGEHRRDQS